MDINEPMNKPHKHLLTRLCFLIAFLFVPVGAAWSQTGQESPEVAVRTDTPSGFPVPRFVSLKSDKSNCRSGPSLGHPVQFTFTRKGLPVRVVAETTDHWRKIKDGEGDQCWVHATLLSGTHTAMIITDREVLRAKIDEKSRIRAEVERGVIGRVMKCQNQHCLMRIGKIAGWVNKSAIWGYRG